MKELGVWVVRIGPWYLTSEGFATTSRRQSKARRYNDREAAVLRALKIEGCRVVRLVPRKR